jgi:hypothetical protein
MRFVLAMNAPRKLIQFDLNGDKDTILHSKKQPQGDHDMTTKALFVKLEAKPGKENEVAKFLATGKAWSNKSPKQPPGLAFDLAKPPSPSSTHFRMMPDATRTCQEKLPKALMEKAPELLAEPPNIEKADVLADRLPG